MMNQTITATKTWSHNWDNTGELAFVSWLCNGLSAILIVSLFAIVYLNFSIRVNTAKLNSLMAEGQRLQVKKDSLLLEREQLQMHHHTESKAQSVYGFQLAKTAKVVNIKV
jgi:cell division protein FtsL